MTKLLRAALVAAISVGGFVRAADLASIDRTIKKEPTYQTKSPRYALLVFGPEARDRVWLVHDGDTLYVDRNGNGDLTEFGEKVAAGSPSDDRCFPVGDVRFGGRLHRELTVSASPLFKSSETIQNQPNAKAALASDAKASVYSISIDLEIPGMKGRGAGGRVGLMVGAVDSGGALLFGDKPATAPVIHFDGPLQVTFFREKPTLMLERDNDLMLVVGTPGLGPGTLAMLCYDGTIPAAAVPHLDIEFPPQKPDAPLVRQGFELRQRC